MGSPKNSLSVSEITELACREADIYSRAEVDGIMIENMHDLPWQRPDELGPETVATMAVVCSAVKKQFPHIPMGVQVLSSGNRHALAIAKAAGLNFIRTEGFVFAHVGDEGLSYSCAADLLRYRKHIDAENTLIFTDVKKKHSSHAITSDISLVDTALAAEMFLSDGIIVTGDATGKPADPLQVNDVQKAVKLPTLVGSGVNMDNVTQYLTADGIIIGSHLKMHGQWYNDLDAAQVKQFMSKVKRNRPKKEENVESISESVVVSTVDVDPSEYDEDDINEEQVEKKDEFKPLTTQGE